MNPFWATIEDGTVRTDQKLTVPNGTRVMITLVEDGSDNDFWSAASEASLAAIWDNEEDDRYAELLLV